MLFATSAPPVLSHLQLSGTPHELVGCAFCKNLRMDIPFAAMSRLGFPGQQQGQQQKREI
jgi:hypothetical protein